MSSFENVAEELSTVTETGLSKVSKLANLQVTLEQRVKDLEEELKQVKREYREIAEDQLPAAMLEHNIREFTLEDNSKIAVKTFYSATIPKDKQEECYDWLNDNGFGDLIKNPVTVNFVRGQEINATDLLQELGGRGMSPSNKKWVEPMTLKAFYRSESEKGNLLPDDKFSLFIGEKATITRKR